MAYDSSIYHNDDYLVNHSSFSSELSTSNERTPLLHSNPLNSLGRSRRGSKPPPYQVYSSRFYILAVFCLANLMQTCIWNTWGPIMDSAEMVFGWNSVTLSLLPNWNGLVYLMLFVPVVILINKKGLQFVMVVAAVMMALGTGVRCINCQFDIRTILMHTCAILDGVTGAIVDVLPPVVSAVWFPSSERTTATAVAITSAELGAAISFIFGPLIVTDRISHYHNPNRSHRYGNVTHMFYEINKYMYVHFGICLIILALVLFHFPKEPFLPPCKSSQSNLRTTLIPSIKSVIKMSNFWLVLIPAGILVGMNEGVSAVLASILIPVNVTQIEAGWIGFVATICGSVTCVVIGWLGDHLPRRPILLVLILLTVMFSTWLSFICFMMLPHNLVAVYVAVCGMTMSATGTMPLFYELGCETCFPASEEVVSGVLTGAVNVVMLVFLAVSMLPALGTAWMPTTFAIVSVLCIPLVLTFEEKNNRRDTDRETDSEEDPLHVSISSTSSSHVTYSINDLEI